MYKNILVFLLLISFIACQPGEKESAPDFNIAFEKFELDNGLEIVFHIDRSDPVVAVALTAHVGSAREKAGKTGFAHLFEHLLFLESENLGKGGLDKMSARIGGSGANGSTSRDRTNYFQTVPNDALEKMLWAEADKLGWFINTVTDPVLAKEKQVVKNEKRQGVDNRPYGHTNFVIDKQLYPEDHPYNWQVIGSLEDLQNTTLADVKEFFNRWYVPNNVTLVVSGDFDEVQAREWVHKYFDEIPGGGIIEPRPGTITESVELYYEDNFARLPELTMVWPTVELYHPDYYPLAVLTQYLSEGKKAPLYQVIVENEKLAANVNMYNRSSELAGQLHLSVRAYADTELNKVLGAIRTGFNKFETAGIDDRDLKRILAGQERDFYEGLSSALGKGFNLAQYNIFAGDPGFIEQDIQNILAVTPSDVMRVYDHYIKGATYIATSFVPRGRVDLAISGSEQAVVEEEMIVMGAEETFDASITATYERTPSSFDRIFEPPSGTTPEVNIPSIWEQELANGMRVYGIENNEVPLLQFNIVIDGGQLMEDFEKLGVANLVAQMMTRGTANKSAQEFEEAIQLLGASLNVYADKEEIRIVGNTLAKNYQATVDLVKEMMLEPRWDESEFALVQQSTISRIQQQKASPNTTAYNAYNLLIYGKDNMRAHNVLGSMESVGNITIEDLKLFYENNFSPSVARMHVVGALSQESIMISLANLDAQWPARAVEIPMYASPAAPETSTVYFYDIPEAKQSVLRIGYPALAATDTDYYPATVMNYILGGGGFASQLTQELRESKGYTYGIRSGFSGSKAVGPFTISSGVRTNITLESAVLIKQIMTDYGKNYSQQDLETTQSSLTKSNARAFETARAKLNLLENISSYGWDYDYVKDRETIVKNMTIEQIRSLSKNYVDPNKMFWLVVGDANTQLDRMAALGFGEPVLINDLTAPED